MRKSESQIESLDVEKLDQGNNFAMHDFVHNRGMGYRVVGYARTLPQWADQFADVALISALTKRAVQESRTGGADAAKPADVEKVVVDIDAVDINTVVRPLPGAGAPGAATLGSTSDSVPPLSGSKVLEELISALRGEANKIENFYNAELAAHVAQVEELNQKNDMTLSSDLEGYDGMRQQRRRALDLRNEYAKHFNTYEELTKFAKINHAFICWSMSQFEDRPNVQALREELRLMHFWRHEGKKSLKNKITLGLAKSHFLGHDMLAEAEMLMYRNEHKSRDHVPTAQNLRVGFLCGICVAMMAWAAVLQAITSFELRPPYDQRCLNHFAMKCKNCTTTEETDMLIKTAEDIYFPIFFHMATVLLWCACWSFLQIFWNNTGINYRACFKLDLFGATANDTIGGCAVMISIWCFYYSLFMQSYHCMWGVPSTPIGLYALLMYITMALYVVYWLGLSWPKLLLSAILSPLTGVSALDGYVGDVLTSLIKPINGIFYAGCVFSTGEFTLKLGEQGECHQWWYKTKKSCWITIAILLFPNVLRILQNLKQLYDSRKQHPCLTNTFKYVLGLLVTMFALMHQTEEYTGAHNVYFYLFLVPFVGSTLYSFFWDIFMDWNLFVADRTCLCFPCGKSKLRGERLYGKPWIYLLAMFADFVLRFFGTMTFVPKAGQLVSGDSALLKTLGYLSPILEVFRRTLWSIFKVENMELGDMAACSRAPASKIPEWQKAAVAQSVHREHKKLAVEIIGVIVIICVAGIIITVTGKSANK